MPAESDAAHPVSPTSSPAPAPPASRVVFRVSAQLRLRRAINLTTPLPSIPTASRPSAATNRITNSAAVFLPSVYDGRKRTFYSRNTRASARTWARPGHACTHRRRTRRARHHRVSRRYASVPVDPGIPAVLQRYPLPNDSAGSFRGNTYATPSSVITNADQFSLRLDNAFSAKDQFFARFNIDNLTGPTTNPDQTAIDPSFGTTYIDRQRNVIGTWTRIMLRNVS